MINAQDIIAAFRDYTPPEPTPIRDFLRQVAIATGLLLLCVTCLAILAAAVILLQSFVAPAYVGPAFGLLIMWVVLFLIVRYVL